MSEMSAGDVAFLLHQLSVDDYFDDDAFDAVVNDDSSRCEINIQDLAASAARHIEKLEAESAALKEENERLQTRVAELERSELITAVLAYRNKGYRGACGATVGADGRGMYAVVYRGLSFDESCNHARDLMRELEASKYQIGECIFVDARETLSGNPISVITKKPANEG